MFKGKTDKLIYEWQDRSDLDMAKVYGEFRRYTNFTKWGVGPKYNPNPARYISISEMNDFDLLFNYGYSQSEIERMTKVSSLPERNKLYELENGCRVGHGSEESVSKLREHCDKIL